MSVPPRGSSLPPRGSSDWQDRARAYLRLADRLLPQRIVGFYVVGSAALGAYEPGRSDVDFVAALDRLLSVAEVRRLRVVHALAAAKGTGVSVARGCSPLSGSCNGVYLLASDLARPLAQVEPVASHVGERFVVGAGSDVNPVTWKILRDGGIPLRGPAPATLDLEADVDALRRWNRENLESYWRRWAHDVAASPGPLARLRARWVTAWGVLGVPRLHYTIVTGEIASKEAAGEYALSTFAPAWHPIIREGLAYRRREPLDRTLGSRAARIARTGEFVLHVIETVRRR